MRSKRAKTDEPAVNAVKIAKPTPRSASSLEHLEGYADTARPGGLTFGDDHEPVKNPESVFAVDDAIETVKSAETCAVCENPMCTAKATYGANNSSAKPKRCHLHKQKTDIVVTCNHPGCTVKYPLVRRSNDPDDGPAICLWHALKTPASYVHVRGTMTCTCGKEAAFGIGKSRLVCGSCAGVVNRHLGTTLRHYSAARPVKIAKPTPRSAASLKHLAGYADTARPGGLTFGDDHEPVKNPESVFAVDDAIESVKSAETCAGCEDPTCTAKATYGANGPSAKPKRCHLHKKETDIVVTCSHPGCVVKYPLVRRSSDPDDKSAICLWHALATKNPTSYVYVRGTGTCTCGNRATFGIGKSKMTCGPCAGVVNRHLGTGLTCIKAGNCAKCGKRGGNDNATRIKTDEAVKVCRPCYIEIETDGTESGFTPGERKFACHEPGCKKWAYLKKTADGTLSCPDHAKGDGYVRIKEKCRENQCTRQAMYAAKYGDTPVACGKHKKKTEFEVTQPRCRVCLVTQLNWYEATRVRKRGDLCRACTQDGGGPVRRFYEKTIVSAIVARLHAAGTEFEAVLDTSIQMHVSSAPYRPDLVLRFDTDKTVFIEIDEHQHASYECDKRREVAIFSSVTDLDRDKMMIRINPDAGGAAFAMFTKIPTVSELLECDDVDAFKTALFDQRLTEILELCTRFVAGDVDPGHVYHINWTNDAPPRPICM